MKTLPELARMAPADGATVVKEPYDMGGGTVSTLADPDERAAVAEVLGPRGGVGEGT